MTRATAGRHVHGQKTREEAATCGSLPRCTGLFPFRCQIRTQFLVDTGACRSLYPRSKLNNPGPRGQDMRAANGSRIATFGKSRISIHHNGRRYSWSFTIADVYFLILGADFLHHHDLMVDMKRQRLLQPSTGASIAAASDDYSLLKHRFRDVFQRQLRARKAPAKHHVKHFITTTRPPVYARFRRLAPDRLKAAKQCFRDMEKQGLCQKASSPWASPLHIVEKKDGTIRPCGDYRRLNNVTEADHYPLPNIADVTSFLHGAAIFSKLDLMKGYYQVPMNPEDIPKTAIVTPFGTYTFNYSCFGLKNAGATFQCLMDDILGDLPFCLCYVDDVLIFSENKQQHLQPQQKRPHRLRRQMHLRRHRHQVPGTPHLQIRRDSPSGEGRRRAEVSQAFHRQGPTRIPGLGYLLPPLPSTHLFHSGTTQRTPQGQTENSLLELRRRRRPCQRHAALLSCSQGRTEPRHRRQRHRHRRSSRAATRRTNDASRLLQQETIQH